jgi:peptide/nickel transport system permease protein
VSLSAAWLSKRLLLAAFTAYLVMSLAFGLVALTPDPGEGRVAWRVAQETGGNETAVREALEDYREARNRDEPVLERYANYLVDTTRLNWGASFSRGRPVTAVLGGALPATARYVALALLLATAGGLALGAYGALAHRTIPDRVVSVVVYGLFGLANFYLGYLLLIGFGVGAGAGPGAGPAGDPLGFLPAWLAGRAPTRQVLLPGVVLTTTLLAGQLRYARAEALEYVDQEFVKLLRSKGAGPLRIGRHVVRNAAIPLLSLFFSELFAVLAVEVIVVEQVFGVRGLGLVALRAVTGRDLPLIVGVAMSVGLLGVVATLLQDVVSRVLDPRVGD